MYADTHIQSKVRHDLTSSSPISEVSVIKRTKSSHPDETDTVDVLASISAFVAVLISS